MKTIFVKPQSVVKKWYLIDAEGKTLGRVAAEAAKILRGKNKAEYVPHQDLGDYVIIINAAKASVTGNKMEDKIYYRHSMYPGGLKAESLEKMLQRKPTYPMEHAIKGMLPHGKLGKRLFTNVKIYAGPEHPHQAQRAQLHFRRLDMRMLRELIPMHADTVQISRAREARRELEEIFQREMQQERRQLDGWDEFE